MGKGLLNFIGGKCKKGHTIEVLESYAGYYVGTKEYDEDLGGNMPYCRISDYGSSEDDLSMAEYREAHENAFCASKCEGCNNGRDGEGVTVCMLAPKQ